MLEEFSALLGVDDFTNEEEQIIKSTLGQPQKVLPFIIRDYSNLGIWEDKLYIYNGSFYQEFSDAKLERLIYAFYLKNSLAPKFSLAKKNEIVFSIKNHHKLTLLDFDKEENLLNLRNGVLNLDTMELFGHDKKYQFSYVINVNYDPNDTKCEYFDKFVQGIFATGGSWEDGFVTSEADVKNIIMMCGYLLYPKIKNQGKMFILLGEGSNGKSILLTTIKMFFDNKFITSMSLSALADERSFHRESIIGSRINICSEQKGGNVDSEELKKIISGETISIQRKFINGALDYNPTTKIIVAANNMPYFNDTTYGTVRRLMLFNFKNKFVNHTEYEKLLPDSPASYGIFKRVDEDEMITNLEIEKSAIFNRFLEGLNMLRERKWLFFDTNSAAQILNEYKRTSDVLGTWISEFYEIGSGNNFITINELYDEFKEWYYKNYGRSASHSSASLGKKVNDRFRIMSERRTVNGERVYGYKLRKKDVSMIDGDDEVITGEDALQEIMSTKWN